MPQVGERRIAHGETREWTGAGWAPVQAGTAAPEQAAPAGPTRYQPGLADTPGTAFFNELARTGKEAATGFIQSPWDALKGLVGLPQQAWKGLTEDIPTLMRDPSLLQETPAAIAQGVRDFGDDPRAGGSLLGQMLLAPKIPGMAETALERGPGMVGRAAAKVGRGVESAGTGLAGQGVLRTALGGYAGGPAGAVTAAISPKALELGGRALQRGGQALEGADVLGGLKRAASRLKPDIPEPEPFVPRSRAVTGGTITNEMLANHAPSLDEFLGPSGPSAGFDWPEAGGRYQPDASGSHKLTSPSREALAPQLLESPSFKRIKRGEQPGTTVSALDEISNPGAQQFFERQDRMLAQPEYADYLANIRRMNAEPRPMTPGSIRR